MNLSELKEMKILALAKLAKELNIEAPGALRKQELIFHILQAQKSDTPISADGVLECCPTASASCAPRLQLPARPRRHLRLALADPPLQPAHRRHVAGQIRPPKESERYFALLKVETSTARSRRSAHAEDPLRQPHAALPQQSASTSSTNPDEIDTRIIDMLCPSAKASAA